MFTKVQCVGVILLAAVLIISANTNAAIVSQWNFDSGSANDSVGTNHGTLMGNAQIVPDSERGLVLALDGSGDCVNLGNSTTIKPQLPVSITAWVKPNIVVPSGTNEVILALDSQLSNYYGIVVTLERDNILGAAYMDGGSPDISSRQSWGGGILQADTWYHIAVVIQGARNFQVYVDGIQDVGHYEGSGSALAYSNAPSYIGSRGGSQRFFNGYIDDVRIYNYALSQDEVAQIIPEPATVIFLSLGFAGLIRRARKN